MTTVEDTERERAAKIQDALYRIAETASTAEEITSTFQMRQAMMPRAAASGIERAMSPNTAGRLVTSRADAFLARA